ncbi:MAG: hypothetical protein CMJ78_04500 [Planctomycetaceae bacterium]|nr:hypothetical protein [Planctomycetaceae bacterium]
MSELHDLDQIESDLSTATPSGIRFGGIMLLLAFAAVIGGGFVFAPQLLGLTTSEKNDGALLHTLGRGRLLVTVTENGNVESASNVDIKCRVAGGSTILWIVEDGKTVTEGEELIRLDDSTIQEQLNQQTIAFEKAVAAKIKAEEDLAAAKLAVREYEEGTFEKELQDSEALIKIAEENLSSYQDLLKHTEKMSRKGFATPLQLKSDEFAVERAKLELKSAEKARDVLVKFTKEKTVRGLEATRDTAEANVRSETAAMDLEQSRLKKLRKQLEYCLIKAPANGMVVYANQNNRRSSQPEVEEGAPVREQQTLIRLPDQSQMQVKVKVHESKIDRLALNMEAYVQIVDTRYKGKIVSIGNQPEPGSWYRAEVKEYAAIIDIEDESELKPGLTAECEIIIDDLSDVLKIPVSCVVEKRGKFFAWASTPTGPERRPLVLGPTNDKEFAVIDGVAEGELVYLNPRAIIQDARINDELDEDEEQPKSKIPAAKSEKKDDKATEKKPSDDQTPAKTSEPSETPSAATDAAPKAESKETETTKAETKTIETLSAKASESKEPEFLPPGAAKPISQKESKEKGDSTDPLNEVNYKAVDSNDDGILSKEEISAARKKLTKKGK